MYLRDISRRVIIADFRTIQLNAHHAVKTALAQRVQHAFKINRAQPQRTERTHWTMRAVQVVRIDILEMHIAYARHVLS